MGIFPYWGDATTAALAVCVHSASSLLQTLGVSLNGTYTYRSLPLLTKVLPCDLHSTATVLMINYKLVTTATSIYALRVECPIHSMQFSMELHKLQNVFEAVLRSASTCDNNAKEACHTSVVTQPCRLWRSSSTILYKCLNYWW